jgi:hypothetical protein
MDTTTFGSSQRPTTGIGGWLALAFLSLVISLPADLFVLLVFSEMCDQTPDPGSVATGRILLLVVLLVAALPWLVATVLSRLSGAGVTIALVALLPAFGFLLYGLTDGAWTTAACFG